MRFPLRVYVSGCPNHNSHSNESPSKTGFNNFTSCLRSLSIKEPSDLVTTHEPDISSKPTYN